MAWLGRTLWGLVLAGSVVGGLALAAGPPGTSRDPDATLRLEAIYAAKGPDYVPKTKLLENGQPKYVNRLIEEVSPYLLQHAHNPVDWRAWSEETLAEAEDRGMPIFLSVGYATCHWCHVMEGESFDNEQVAAVLNAHFIPIKMDREQHPELDHLYITATQIQQGHAGWPNSVWLTPDGRPFHTGTYFPREDFLRLLSSLADAWATRRGEVDQVASALSGALDDMMRLRTGPSVPIDSAVFAEAADGLAAMHNDLEGGFSQSQQFPREGFVLFLLDQWRATGEARARDMASLTLHAIAAGGIHDHVGGGFHRYTVDPNWRTPHFEKMLYNQALLARAFVEGWEITGDPAWRRAAERIFEYVARDMTDPAGAFYAAEDADSLSASGTLEEGAFYVWRPTDPAIAGTDAITALGLAQPATVEMGAVPHLPLGETVDFTMLDPLLDRLLIEREARPRPLRDEKIIAGWNGLMIRALADGATAFQLDEYADQAARAAEVVWSRLWTKERLNRFWAGGQIREEGVLQDYAWLGLGMVALFDATGEELWLSRATDLARLAWTRFGDGTGRLKMAALDGPLGPIYDNTDDATPSGESSALELFAALAVRTQHPEVAGWAEALRSALSSQIVNHPLNRLDALVASRKLDGGGTGFRRTLARGNVRVRLRDQHLHLSIASGWHINAHDAGASWLIGASLDGAETDWPAGIPVRLGFTTDELRVYEGALSLPFLASGPEISLSIQACSNEICLDPETATFRLP